VFCSDHDPDLFLGEQGKEAVDRAMEKAFFADEGEELLRIKFTA
jgi:hypothetical protein